MSAGDLLVSRPTFTPKEFQPLPERRDLSGALRLTRRVKAGTVWVNGYGRSRDHILPTGGDNRSGIGKDLGREAYLPTAAPGACSSGCTE
jgi:hypothetical protein